MYIIICIILLLKISLYESIDNSLGVWDMFEIYFCIFILCVCIFKFIGGVVIYKVYYICYYNCSMFMENLGIEIYWD